MSESKNPKKNKHLTPEDRKEIEECLSKRMTFKAIADLIGKDPTTISYEVKHHRSEHHNGYVSMDGTCPLLLKAPFVCNGCPKKYFSSCRYLRFYYRSGFAQSEYKALLSDAREGTPLNKEEFYENDRIITSGLKNGQHLYQIMVNSAEISCSKSTVYRHFQKGYYSAGMIDLPRAVKFKPRRARKGDYVPSGLRTGRSYDEFQDFINDNHIPR